MRVHGIINSGALTGSENSRLPESPAEKRTKKNAGSGSAVDGGRTNGRDFTREELEQAVEQLNKTMRTYYTELQFQVHEKSGEMIVKVLDRETDTVIREIPPEKTLDMVAHFKEILGIMIDKMI